jgi:hypothetical protein
MDRSALTNVFGVLVGPFDQRKGYHVTWVEPERGLQRGLGFDKPT